MDLELVERLIETKRKLLGPGYYNNLVNAILDRKKVDVDPRSPHNKHVGQIELDLLGTFPNNRHFNALDSVNLVSLRNILNAFLIHNPGVGEWILRLFINTFINYFRDLEYCRGMNWLAGRCSIWLRFVCLAGERSRFSKSLYFGTRKTHFGHWLRSSSTSCQPIITLAI